MKFLSPRKIALVGGALICISGLLNLILGLQIGAMFYEIYLGGKMGHVGIFAGLTAIIIGLVIVFLVVPIYQKSHRGLLVLAGILTIILGHLGGIAGAIYVGTVGVVLCYISGIWILLKSIKK